MTTARSKGPRALPRAALPTGPAALLIADAEERAAIEPVLKTGGLALTTRLIDIRDFDLENFLLDLEDAFEGPLARTAVVVVAADLLVDARIDIINLLDQILEPGRPILVSCSQATATEQSALADHPQRIVGFSMLPLLGGHRVIEVAGTARTDPAIVERVRALFQLAVQGQTPAKSALNLAMVAEPSTLDPMASTADLVGTIMQHVYEPLYTFDANWKMVPMLAEGMPKISADGKKYNITLRKGVMLHNGRELNSEDVVLSLKRWMEVSPRGKALSKEVIDLTAIGADGIEITLKAPYAPLLPQLALPSGMAAIMAKESIATPLKEFIGTGPYKFKERRPDQYVLLTRFDQYSARKEAASGYGGKKVAMVEELRFIPVPNANTRVEGSLAGQYHFADLLPTEALSIGPL